MLCRRQPAGKEWRWHHQLPSPSMPVRLSYAPNCKA